VYAFSLIKKIIESSTNTSGAAGSLLIKFLQTADCGVLVILEKTYVLFKKRLRSLLDNFLRTT